jgi:hypothetical protein
MESAAQRVGQANPVRPNRATTHCARYVLGSGVFSSAI